MKDGLEDDGNGVEDSKNVDGNGNRKGTSIGGEDDANVDDDDYNIDEMAVVEHEDSSDGPSESTETSTVARYSVPLLLLIVLLKKRQ